MTGSAGGAGGTAGGAGGAARPGFGAAGEVGGTASGMGGPAVGPIRPNYDAPVAADLAREAMLHRLASLAPPGGGVSVTATGAGAWRPVDDDLAMLVYDSRLDPDLLSAVRSSGTDHRQLTFRARQLVLELDVAEGSPLQVMCQVVPAQRARLTIRHRSGIVDLGEDRHGLFHVPRLPDGPVSLRCVPLAEGLEPVATSWLAL